MSLSPLQWTHAPGALLGVNIDHVATVRNARGGLYPDPVALAQVALEAGADIITFHLREDRRHIRDADVERMKAHIKAPLNFEAAVTDEMIALIERIQPEHVCLVPERRQEVTTEGGLELTVLVANEGLMEEAVHQGEMIWCQVHPEDAVLIEED